jgi:DNA-binding NarL/FixJ family response regulator
MGLFIFHRRPKPWRRTRQQLRDKAFMTLKRVLVADDLAPVLNAVADLLRESFDVVGMVSDGREALIATLKLEPELVVLDISMPLMSGIEVAEELKRQGNKAKVVFLTVHEDHDILKTCRAAGGLGYVIKVLMATDLVPAMNQALAGHIFTSRFPSQQDIP